MLIPKAMSPQGRLAPPCESCQPKTSASLARSAVAAVMAGTRSDSGRSCNPSRVQPSEREEWSAPYARHYLFTRKDLRLSAHLRKNAELHATALTMPPDWAHRECSASPKQSGVGGRRAALKSGRYGETSLYRPELRGPKSEGRKKPETRSPNRPPGWQVSNRSGEGLLRISDFGLPSSFGLRI